MVEKDSQVRVRQSETVNKHIGGSSFCSLEHREGSSESTPRLYWENSHAQQKKKTDRKEELNTQTVKEGYGS